MEHSSPKTILLNKKERPIQIVNIVANQTANYTAIGNAKPFTNAENISQKSKSKKSKALT